MPITKSAKKALRQSVRKRNLNLRKKRVMRDVLLKIKKLRSEDKKTEAQKLIHLAYKAIDKSAKSGVIKKRTASRKKSRLTKYLKQ